MAGFEQKTLVTVGLILIIILGLWSYVLYHQSNFDSNGNELGCLDTIRNIFGISSINFLLTGREDGDLSHMNLEESNNHFKLHDLEMPLEESQNEVIDSIEETEKEVFNIDNSTFTYNDAELICKAYGSDLASYQQVVKAHQKGANWCNYGWSKGKMALFPIQQDHYDELQKNKDESIRNSCGKPGVNGGKFTNSSLKFSANCYGIKPKADPSKITYITPELIAKTKTIKEAAKVDKFQKLIDDGTVEIRPFNDNQWSKYSTKKSTYMLTPKQALELVVTETRNDLELDPRAITKEQPELEIVDVNKPSPTDVL